MKGFIMLVYDDREDEEFMNASGHEPECNYGFDYGCEEDSERESYEYEISEDYYYNRDWN